jgi:hypothetical protein
MGLLAAKFAGDGEGRESAPLSSSTLVFHWYYYFAFPDIAILGLK